MILDMHKTKSLGTDSVFYTIYQSGDSLGLHHSTPYQHRLQVSAVEVAVLQENAQFFCTPLNQLLIKGKWTLPLDLDSYTASSANPIFVLAFMTCPSSMYPHTDSTG
jgi:hypothetical protein